ncbi:hypothetical protein C802_00415 [Phocaeicola sartorii]|uniref:Uncharacterized protein n=1 Tax=Phocaeicola sartorii TaxID=671267 RepID=R9ICD9_9BACT|nr:hypothetical protein C802_00415 [Phocaeicola sartorii]
MAESKDWTMVSDGNYDIYSQWGGSLSAYLQK